MVLTKEAKEDFRAMIRPPDWQIVGDEVRSFFATALTSIFFIFLGSAMMETMLIGAGAIQNEFGISHMMWPLYIQYGLGIALALSYMGAWLELGKYAGKVDDKVFFVIWCVASVGWVMVLFFGLLIYTGV